ncbi:MAG: phytanoyl-CoA dioxygenase family protein [Acidobacteria bacterium]|nr:phytanoyl-CoA dioxygenase family protein [Acidobacteriota bacterium]MCB9396337.1 phytanoyl-CoA dioxygenase family protein [Acidobacteriota bacterium]
MNQCEFREKGYYLSKQLLSAEWVKIIKGFLTQELPLCLEKVQKEVPIADWSCWGSALQNWLIEKDLSQLSGEIRNVLCGHFRLETRLNPILTTICQQRFLIDTVRALLGEGFLCLHMPPVARFILPNNPFSRVPAHQDIQYNSFLGHFLTAWVPLVPIDDKCGGVLVYEGRPEGVLSASDPGGPFWLPKTDPQDREVRVLSMQPGDVLFLDPYILHESAPNRAEFARLSLDYRFFLRREKAQKHYMEVDTLQLVSPDQEAAP